MQDNEREHDEAEGGSGQTVRRYDAAVLDHAISRNHREPCNRCHNPIWQHWLPDKYEGTCDDILPNNTVMDDYYDLLARRVTIQLIK